MPPRAPLRPKPPAAKKAADPDLAKLPKALRKRAQAMADSAHARLTAAAKEAFAQAKAALAESNRHLHALGVALATLKKPAAAEALGFADFADLHENGLGLSRTTVGRLLRAIEHLSQERYAALGPDRVDALLDLADATEADDTAEILDEKKVVLWAKGPSLDVAAADNAALREAAKEVRARRAETGSGTKRGRTTTPAERKVAKDGTAALTRAGSAAKLTAKATKPGQPARFDLTALTEAEARRALRGLGVKLP